MMNISLPTLSEDNEIFFVVSFCSNNDVYSYSYASDLCVCVCYKMNFFIILKKVFVKNFFYIFILGYSQN